MIPSLSWLSRLPSRHVSTIVTMILAVFSGTRNLDRISTTFLKRSVISSERGVGSSGRRPGTLREARAFLIGNAHFSTTDLCRCLFNAAFKESPYFCSLIVQIMVVMYALNVAYSNVYYQENIMIILSPDVRHESTSRNQFLFLLVLVRSLYFILEG